MILTINMNMILDRRTISNYILRINIKPPLIWNTLFSDTVNINNSTAKVKFQQYSKNIGEFSNEKRIIIEIFIIYSNKFKHFN